MRLARPAVHLALLTLALAWLPGASRANSAPKAKPAKAAPKATAKPARPSLPDWFPKHPSPEFLRAARVLKPMPRSVWADHDARHPEMRGRHAATERTWPAAWEVFGATMTDAHIRVLQSTVKTKGPDGADRAATERWLAGQPKVPIKALTRKQRALVDNYLNVCRRNSGDWLVGLYKKAPRRTSPTSRSDSRQTAIGSISSGGSIEVTARDGPSTGAPASR